MPEIGWEFPSTDGGAEDGFNDAGISTFMGEPYASLAREMLQNSLDAAEFPSEKPAEVRFRIMECSPEDIGAGELTDIFARCARCQREDSKERRFFEKGKKILASKIAVLEISDKNTTGCAGRRWNALVKQRGTSENSKGAGGSFGIGKHAPFAVSDLRTVFYWSCFPDDVGFKEQFQGKVILTSHTNKDGDMRQGTGFWGRKERCREIQQSESIPELFRLPFGPNVPGTSVYIMGFSKSTKWNFEMIKSIICNFFYSLSTERLKVQLKFDSNLEISGNTIGAVFETLAKNHENDQDIEKAKAYWRLSLGENAKEREKEIPGLGPCRLLVQTGGLPPAASWLKRVGIVRGSGMMITDRQPKLSRFGGVDDFLALCICEDLEGNELLRKMENPQHDKFEPLRIQDRDSRKKATEALKELVGWIKECIEEIAGRQARGKPEHLGELAQFLPDFEPEENLQGEEERDLEGGQEVSGRRRPIPPVPGLPPDPDPDPARQSPLSNVRIRPSSSQNPAEKRISFTTHTDGKLLIRVYMAGDSNLEEIHSEKIDAKKNGRNNITVNADGESSLVARAYKTT